jgi:DNA-binding winged helix-turn-helix (wHTH) protein
VFPSAKGNVISKDEIVAQLWPGRAVEEGNLHVQVSTSRGAGKRTAMATAMS